uniref:protein-tyrosine-phosphatase n=1 Tax=Clastoptera arizonana TaxID=38151 RepID=A0A1B6D5J2_9HEMI
MEEQNDLNSIEKEFNEIDSRKLWILKYQEIMKECIKFDYTLLEAKKLKNKNLNRYRDVSPYDHSRIILSKGPCDYINANLIKMEKAHRQYILTQGPLSNTTPHFWLMVWEQNCKAVLMLNRIVEKNQVKCHQYWPIGSLHGGDDIMVLTEVGLKIENIKENEFSYYTTRILRLTEIETGSSREILHFHYTTWPDFGVPQSPTVFLSFLSLVRESGALDQNVGPPVVHCSAGIGRSGTFCLVDSCLVMMKENGCNSVNVQDVLINMRRQRMGLIQTADQLRFSYLAIIEGSKMDLEKINDNDLINANHRRTSEDEEEPPPLPPPRGESLKNTLPPLPPVPENNLLPPLPCEPNVSSSSSNSSSEESSPIHQISENGTQNKNTNFDLRQRKRKIEQTLTAERIEEMKRKQQNAEYWNRIKRRSKKTKAED